MHACPNNLLCVNGSCIGCIDENDCSTGDDCVLTQCINQQCVYKYLDRCAQNNDDDNSSSAGGSYIPNLPYIKPEIEVIDNPIIKENIIEEETKNNNKEEQKEEKGFFSCSSTSANLEVILYLIFIYFILIKKRNEPQN